LISRKIDVGFLRPPIDKLFLTSEKIMTERLSVVLRRSSPLAKHKRLGLKQIANEPLLLIARNISSGVYDKTLDLYREAGLNPKIIPTETTPLDEAGAILVNSGKGIYIAVGSHPCHPSFADRLAVVPLSNPSAAVEAHVAWRKDEKNRTVLNFVDFTRQMFASTSRRAQP
jgi:DNA-binding transcriptional LysR family regulator